MVIVNFKLNKIFKSKTQTMTAYNWLKWYFWTILHFFKNLFNFLKWWWQNSCAERFRFIFRHPFVGTFPLIRCYKCLFAWKFSIKWFSRACFRKCFVENSSNISIAYLISVDYFKFWLTFKEMKDFKPYKDLQEWSFKSWNCSVFLIYITELKKKLNTFLSYSY